MGSYVCITSGNHMPTCSIVSVVIISECTYHFHDFPLDSNRLAIVTDISDTAISFIIHLRGWTMYVVCALNLVCCEPLKISVWL